MKVLIVQNTVQKDIDKSLENVTNLIEKRQEPSPDIIVLPEMFTTPYEVERFAAYAQTENGSVLTFLRDLAMTHKAYVIGGSVPEKHEGALYNTTFIFNREGNRIATYRKIHLFAITYPDGTRFDEAEVLCSGDELGLFETEFGTMGVMICFDIRYPALAERLVDKGAKALFVPGAFNGFTGPLHWHTTFRARATDNQAFMIGCSASADSFGSYETYGHSLVADPLGNVIASLKGDEGIIEINVDLSRIDHARSVLPIRANKKALPDG